jgi:hypothetical protein
MALTNPNLLKPLTSEVVAAVQQASLRKSLRE